MIWLLFVLISSILEAIMFHKKIFVKDIHYYLTILRALFCIPLALQNDYTLIYIFICILSFPFLHDGIYYTFRHLLNRNVYKKMFFDTSTTTSAILSFSLFWRVIFFIFSLGLLPLILS